MFKYIFGIVLLSISTIVISQNHSITSGQAGFDYATVIDVMPIYAQTQPVYSPPICTNQTVPVHGYVTQQYSNPNGSGMVVGALVGGVLGSLVGNGSGQIVATVIGAAIGSQVGQDYNSTVVQQPITTYQNVQNCSPTQIIEQPKLVITGYRITYLFGNRSYESTTTQYVKPGDRIRIAVGTRIEQ